MGVSTAAQAQAASALIQQMMFATEKKQARENQQQSNPTNKGIGKIVVTDLPSAIASVKQSTQKLLSVPSFSSIFGHSTTLTTKSSSLTSTPTLIAPSQPKPNLLTLPSSIPNGNVTFQKMSFYFTHLTLL